MLTCRPGKQLIQEDLHSLTSLADLILAHTMLDLLSHKYCKCKVLIVCECMVLSSAKMTSERT